MAPHQVGASAATSRADQTYPRLLQSGFAALVAVDVLVRLAAGDAYGLGSWAALGTLLVAVATAVTALAGWRPGLERVLLVVPFVDILGLGLLRLVPGGGGSSALVVLPALWLGWRHGRRGAVLAVLGALLLQSLPGVLYLGADDAVAASRALVLPAVAGMAAWSVALLLETVDARTRLAEQRGHQLESTLAELRREARVNDTVLETADVGMVLLDSDGTYRAVNRRHRDFLALAYPGGHAGSAGQEGEVRGADGTTLLTREQMPAVRAAAGEQFDDVRIWVGSDPATMRALSVSARPVLDAQGRVEGAVLAYHDVTDLVRALEVKDDFVATVSHELRTPLTSILGYLDVVLERDDLDDQVRAHLGAVSRNAARLLRLVTDLLHPVAAGPGGLRLRRRPEELGSVVQEAVEAAEPAAREAGVELRVVLPAPVPAVVDRARIGELLGQLLSNAVKYNRPGGTVVVEARSEDGAAVLHVRDDGVGVHAADPDELFTRFLRGSNARDGAVQGVGLGLAIAQGIVRGHGGSIAIASEPGRGTTVTVRLPAAPSGAADVPSEGPVAAPAWD